MTENVTARAFKDCLPVMAGYLVLGTGFGMMARAEGLGIFSVLAMSIFIYAGSLQYVLVSLISGAAPLLVAAVTSFLVNARHLFYGISMTREYQDTGRRKPYLIFALTDETYSLVVSPPEGFSEADRKNYYFWVSLFDQCWWVMGSILGILAGAVLPVRTEGVDFALTALFITVFTGQWLENKDHRPALIGLGASVLALLLFGPDRFLLPAMGLMILLLLFIRRSPGKEEAHA